MMIVVETIPKNFGALLLAGSFACLLAFLSQLRKKLSNASREINPKPQKENVLEETLVALKATTLATRAEKLGADTLRNVWRLNNPFTSDSLGMQQKYRQELIKCFHQTKAEDWSEIAQSATKAVEPHLYLKQDTQGSYHVCANVQSLSRNSTLAANLKGFFDIDNVADDRLTYIGTEVNRITVGKKHYDAGAYEADYLPRDLSDAAARLIDNLRDLFLEAKDSSQLARTLLCRVSGTPEDFNPLNLVIPAFEVPWRVTYYTLLALLQGGPNKQEYLNVVRDSRPDLPPSPAALAVIYESLRLYPPVRRVRRDDRVDVETVQRHSEYWGLSASDFDPSRFLDKDGNINDALIGADSAWMPFAAGRMKCPSAGGYSARLAIVIVGAILRKMFPEGQKPHWYLTGPEWDEQARKGCALRAGRDEYASVSVVVSELV